MAWQEEMDRKEDNRPSIMRIEYAPTGSLAVRKFTLKQKQHERSTKKPMQPDEIEWRIQSARNGKTTVVPYLKNRAVMDRLDAAFSPDGWCNTFERWGVEGC